MTITRQLVEWAWQLDLNQVPARVQHAACRHLLDGTGTAIAGLRYQAVPYVLSVAEQTPSPPESTVIGTGRKLPSAYAAFANGALVHALDYDDTHAGALVHATATVLPAAFAVGERTLADGNSILTAAISGFETVARIGRAVPHGFHRRGFHATSVCGVFSAALVASRLEGLSETEAVNALGIAGSQASGSLEFLSDGSSTKQLHPGWCSLAGVTASRLASAGATGPDTILEGPYGLYRSYAGESVEPESVLDGLGSEWETSKITIKPYPVCQLSHASLDALSQLLGEIPDLAMIEAIDFDIPNESIPVVCEPNSSKIRPRSAYEAKFSLAWTAAVLLVDGLVDILSFVDLDRSEVRDLASRVHYRGYDCGTVPANAPGRVTVSFREGTRLTAETPASRGGPNDPLTDSQLKKKFFDNCGPEVADPDAIADGILGLKEVQDLTNILVHTTIPEKR